MSSHRPGSGGARLLNPPHRLAAALAVAVAVLLLAAPGAFAWHGHLQVRKVNVGGPAADTFTFKVEGKRYGQTAWTLLPATDYSGAAFGAKLKPDNPFVLYGAAPGGSFVRTGPTPTEARFTDIDAAGDSAAPAPAIRDWRSFRITETVKPAGYKTSATCTIANDASGAEWTSGLSSAWGAWSATPTSAGGGDGMQTELRWLPDTVALDSRGPWTVTCTFTNTYRARVRVSKRFQTPVGNAPRVAISVGGTDVRTSTGAETFGDGDASDWIAVDGGADVALAERGASGTVLTDYTSTLECRSGTGGAYGDWAVVPGGTAGTLQAVQPGKDYECRFTNVGRPPGGGVSQGPPTSGGTPTGGGAPPAGPVTPSGRPTGRTATARVVGTTGCVSSSHAIADVRGRQIARVTFRINGRVAKTLTSANVAGMYRLRVAASSLPKGASRVTADVVFKAAARTAPKRLRLAFSRCVRRTDRPPPFTG